MKIGNLACGAVRPQGEEWWNVDTLHSVLAPGTPERAQLDSEPRYIDRDLEKIGVPFDDNSMDSLMLSHALEHWECNTGAAVMWDCHRALKPGGVLLVSVPDASYFRKVHDEDTVENAERLFGEPIFLGDGETTFTGYGLWCPGRHKVLITEDVLWHYFKRSGFEKCGRVEIGHETVPAGGPFTEAVKWTITFPQEMLPLPLFAEKPALKMVQHLNRLPFSLVMCGIKE